MDDFYGEAAKTRFENIAADRAEALATLERARVSGDWESASSAVQAIADLDTAHASLVNLCNRYIASQNPPRPPEPTREERLARPIHAMDWNDIVDMTRQSKYAKNIRPDDPDMIAGYHEAMRRRRAGE
jgi:hypothetical protein